MMQPASIFRVAFYLRASTMALADKQATPLRQTAAGMPDWRVVAAFCDIDPGPDLPGRIGAVRAAQSGGFDLLLMASLDRLTRNTNDLHDLIDQFTAANVILCSLGRRPTSPPRQEGDGPDLLVVTGNQAGPAVRQMRTLAAHRPLPALTSRPTPTGEER